MAQPTPGAAPQAQTLNPQQMQQMQLVVKQAMQTLLPRQVADAIVIHAKHGDPAQVIAQYASPLLANIWKSAAQAGQNVDMVTMMVAGYAVMAQLAEMLWHAGVLNTPQDALMVSAQAAKLAIQQHNASIQQQPPGAQAGPGPQGPPGGPPAAGGMIGGV